MIIIEDVRVGNQFYDEKEEIITVDQNNIFHVVGNLDKYRPIIINKNIMRIALNNSTVSFALCGDEYSLLTGIGGVSFNIKISNDYIFFSISSNGNFAVIDTNYIVNAFHRLQNLFYDISGKRLTLTREKQNDKK